MEHIRGIYNFWLLCVDARPVLSAITKKYERNAERNICCVFHIKTLRAWITPNECLIWKHHIYPPSVEQTAHTAHTSCWKIHKLITCNGMAHTSTETGRAETSIAIRTHSDASFCTQHCLDKCELYFGSMWIWLERKHQFPIECNYVAASGMLEWKHFEPRKQLIANISRRLSFDGEILSPIYAQLAQEAYDDGTQWNCSHK